jgi:DNA-binding response OmpR family regulator
MQIREDQMKVLIVEDNGLIALELERIVSAAGHDVVGPVATLEQALAYAGAAQVALVDLGLADGDSGSQLARRLIDRFRLKVIFVTGSPSQVGLGLEGSSDIIAKPFSDAQIIQGLEKAGAELHVYS